MKIVLTGGGSGGHITPLLAVAHELKKLQPDIQLYYIGEKGSRFREHMASQGIFEETYAIPAGKLRRYHGDSWFKRLIDIKTNFLNLRDAWRLARGLRQSRKLLKRIKPDGVFMRGGFVSLPVCKMAAKLGIPYVTHEADSVPSLTNKLLAKRAAKLATGMPTEFYDYPKNKMVFTGIPITDKFQPVDEKRYTAYRKDLKVGTHKPVIFITGGGLGAQRLNEAVAGIAEKLIAKYPDIVILHQVGQGNGYTYDDASAAVKEHVRAEEFITELYKYSGAADVVITRAGATAIAEMAVQHKACIIVPSPLFPGAHQTKNAERLREGNMARVVTEEDLWRSGGGALLEAICELLDSPEKRRSLGQALAALAKPDAANDISRLLITTFAKEGRANEAEA